jgi:CheY-like chemotaxis protein
MNEIKKAKVLVVEDNLIDQTLIVKMLQNLGHESQVVTNGYEAVDELRGTAYDVILMDCQMPECDGFEATRLVRSLESLNSQNVIILAITANIQSGDEKKCLAAGMNGYLPKPISMDKLGLTLDEWLNKKK